MRRVLYTEVYCMDFKNVCQDIQQMGINLYDLAFYYQGNIREHRFQPSNFCNNCYSIAKVFMVTALGMLHDDGLLDVKKSLKLYLGNLIPPNADPAWQVATVEDAMTHKLGFDTGFLDIDVENASEYPSREYLDLVFSQPIVYVPGQHRQYSDGAYYLISRLINEVAGEKVNELLNRRLFQPLKVREVAWSCCPQNHPIGATGLYLSAYDLVKLPTLYLQGGLWEGQRILSKEWVDKVIGNEYELTTKKPSGLIGKSGMYGQMILFSREKNFAVAWHAFSTENEKISALVDYFDGYLK